MSRNLGEITCRWCDGDVVLEEAPRPIAVSDCGPHYLTECVGLIVAHAHCADCEAQYLAWIDGSLQRSGWPSPARYPHESLVRDLSFRSTFNDEPGHADFPKYAIERGIVKRTPWSDEVAVYQKYAAYWKGT